MGIPESTPYGWDIELGRGLSRYNQVEIIIIDAVAIDASMLCVCKT